MGLFLYLRHEFPELGEDYLTLVHYLHAVEPDAELFRQMPSVWLTASWPWGGASMSLT